MALITTEQRNDLIGLVITMFNAAPGVQVLSDLAGAVEHGSSLKSIAGILATKAPFQDVYPTGLTSAEFADRMVANLLPASTPASAVTWSKNWIISRLNAGETRANVLYAAWDALAHTTNPNYADAQTQLENKVTVATYYSVDAGQPTTTLDQLQDIIANVTADPATVTAAIAEIDKIGVTSLLTTGPDDINIITSGSVDTIRGVWSGTNTDTFTIGDNINGNGLTIVEVVTGNPGAAPYVTMSRVDQLSIVSGAAGTFTMDAGDYGSDISKVSLRGADGTVLDITDLTVKGSLDVSIANASASTVSVTGTVDGLNFDIELQNDDDADGVGAVASVGTAGVNVTLGTNDGLSYTLSQSVSKSAAAVSVGNLTIGDINYSIAKSAYVDASLTNYAHNNGTGSATAGNLTIGNISAEIAAGGYSADFHIYNSATADSGAATVGNVTIGNIDYQIADSATGMSTFYVYNSAESTNGNATAGNITLGNVTSVAGNNVDYASYLYTYNYATANTTGNAVVGNTVAGDISVTAGDDTGGTVYFSQQANSTKGSATAGSITVGDVNMVMGNDVNTGESLNFSVYNYATATTGAATVGAVTIGDINAAVGTSQSFTFYLYNSANSSKGAATVGAVTVGNVTETAVSGGYLYNYIQASADGTAGDKVGNVIIGAIDMYGQPDADLNFEVYVRSDTGSVADVTIGNIDMKVDNDGSVSFELDAWAKTNVGNVTIGDVNLTLGSSASIDTFSVSVTASTGDIASFTIGNVNIVGAKSSYDGDQGFNVSAGDDLGNVTIGDVSVIAGVSASFTSMTWDFTAVKGDIADVAMGNTTMTAAASANNWRYVNFTADGEIGDVVAGDVTLTAAKSASVWLSHNYSASDDIGNIAYGDIVASANGKNAAAGFSFEVDANGNTVGTVAFGDVTLSAAGDGASAGVSIWLNDTGDTVGLATVGDITLNGSNTKAAASAASVTFQMDSNGSITVGDITVAAAPAATTYADTAVVNFLVDINTAMSLTVGNITVTGGSENATPTAMDNLATLTTWLQLTETGSGSITVGNVDYSGYELGATIDVSGFKGAANIFAAQGDTVITDNKGKNVITLNDGNDTVNLNATTATTNETSATGNDEIVNFESGSDVLNVTTVNAGTDFSFVSLAAADYNTFLTAATNSMTNFGTDIYARAVGSDLFVAFDDNGDGTADFVVKMVGITSITAADINII